MLNADRGPGTHVELRSMLEDCEKVGLITIQLQGGRIGQSIVVSFAFTVRADTEVASGRPRGFGKPEGFPRLDLRRALGVLTVAGFADFDGRRDREDEWRR